MKHEKPIYIGTTDKNGVQVRVGDILDFDEREWGGSFTPEQVPPLIDFVEEWPMCGTFSDISECRTIIDHKE